MTLDSAVRRAFAQGALRLASGGAWREASIFDLADAAGLAIEDLAGATPMDAVDAVEESFDRAMSRGLKRVDAAALVRDRLFDIVMRRFEAMEPHRTALLAIEAWLAGDPAALALQHARNVRAARWALTLSGVEADGMAGAARAQGLAVILAQVRSAWRGDVGGDFSKTMAALDKALRQAEKTFGRFGGFESAPAQEPPVATPPPLADGA